MMHAYFSGLVPGSRWLAAVPGLLLTLSAAAQNTTYTVSGRVVDSRAEPVPGATVRVLNTVLGASTDVDGNYSLTVALAPGTYSLAISAVGYQPRRQAVTLGTASAVAVENLTLPEDLVQLNDVVVTGTSVATSKKQLGNTIAIVSGEQLRTTVPTQIDHALQGKFAGVQITQNSGNPAGGISVRLRGPSTVSGSSDPLYIIDGVLIDNSSPQLLDLGGYAQNRLVDISPNDVERIEVIKGAAAAAIYGSRANNGVVQIFTKRGQAGKPQVTVQSNFLTSQIRKTLAYNQTPFRFTNNIATDLTQVPVERYDYQKDIFRTATGTDNYVSISGGTTNTKYFASTNYFRNQGIVDNTDFTRGGVRLRVQQNLGSKANLSVGANYSLTNSSEIPNGGINEAYGALTGFIFSSNYVNPTPDPVTGRYPSTSPAIPRTNPLEAINRFDFGQRTSRFIGDLQLNLTPVKGFTTNFTLGYDNSTQIGNGFIPVGNTTPTYGTGLARRADQTGFLVNADLTLSYKRDLTPWLASTTTMGGTQQYQRYYNTAIQSIMLTSGISTAAGGNGTTVAGEEQRSLSIRGAFAQQTFGFYDQFFLTGALRVDAASIYGESQRTQYYPKVGASYVVSQAKFWADGALARVFPQFKLRASYGQSGNLTAVGAFERFTNYDPLVLGTLPGLFPGTRQGNQNLGPERQAEFEAGVDASLFNERLGFEVSFYNKKVTDLLLRRQLKLSSGFSSRLDNIGNMTNRGFELLVRAQPVRSEKVTWNVTGTYTRNRNKIINIPTGFVAFDSGFGLVAAVEGKPLGVWSRSKVGGLSNKGTRIFLPLRTHKFIGCQALEPLEPLGEVVGL